MLLDPNDIQHLMAEVHPNTLVMLWPMLLDPNAIQHLMAEVHPNTLVVL